ncbi:ABC transporter, permease protein [Marvinbryantia formatexigens DSM 14469]|uniref:ABC transporter, permease protein n=1 Tax=Marvinbryantia formatexigens DSM 14469 TaxID=478749 RepID=C6LJD1_9FIRM|nr:ABC transporter permease [Marvinbryantia formatexigens]EET59245.1 ABC transporter, permease protein [Marvinbryantia formatexigens DSM 14469]UWO25424.1 ABC transporter permease [Marvinbryantia formatexigens DSM 14469]SDG74567.1 NitT/TauT family transport system permease protein [Marvinbryantia formatexigens]
MIRVIRRTVLSFAGLLLIWQLAVTFGNFNPVLFPGPRKVLEAFVELCTTGLAGSSSQITLIGHLRASMIRFLAGYLASVGLGVLSGLLLGWFPAVFAYVNPVIQLLRPIAPVAWLPFIVLWVGIGDVPAIAIIFIAGFFPVLLSTAAAVKNVDRVYLKVAENFRLSQPETLLKIVFPAVFPQIASSLHMALGTCWIFLVSGEMVGSQTGLGFLVMDAKNCIRADALLAVMLTIGLVGLALDFLIGLFEKKVAQIWGFRAPEYGKGR